MTGFDRRRRVGIDGRLTYVGHGSIPGALFDLGIYPAAVPAPDGRVRGAVYEMQEAPAVLSALDEVEGYIRGKPDNSLYMRVETAVKLDDGRDLSAWAYLHDVPHGGAQ